MRVGIRRGVTVAIASGLALAACGGGADGDGGAPTAYPLDDTLRVNEVQVLNSHNSYHRRSDVDLPPAIGDPVDYEHAPLDVELEERGVRGFELDVVNTGTEFRVEHIPVVDDETTCTPITECLRIVKEWSDAHPGHVPIFVMVEPKAGPTEFSADPSLMGFDAATLRRLDDDIRSVLTPADLLTPDEVRSDFPTLREAVTTRGWPTLDEVRGTIALVLLTSENERADYLEGRRALEGAAMFVTARVMAPSAAVIKVDDPYDPTIPDLVRAGFVVRTRTDADVIEARAGDTTRANQAFVSGAQLVSTDFPVADPLVHPTFAVQIPNGKPGRCNPINAPRRCDPLDVENPQHLRARPE